MSREYLRCHGKSDQIKITDKNFISYIRHSASVTAQKHEKYWGSEECTRRWNSHILLRFVFHVWTRDMCKVEIIKWYMISESGGNQGMVIKYWYFALVVSKKKYHHHLQAREKQGKIMPFYKKRKEALFVFLASGTTSADQLWNLEISTVPSS